jgi:hypothetical protein
MRFRAQLQPNTAAIATFLIILAGFVFCLAVDLPGHLSYDSVVQLLEGRRGAYAGWHPPVMSWLLGIFDALVPGASLFVIFDSVLLFGCLLSFLLLRPRPSWAAAFVAVVLVASPQFLIYPGIVWKDVLFAVLSVFGFVCLAHAAAQWTNARLRFCLIVLSFAALTMAALARQNGAVVVPAAAVALGWIATRQSTLRRGIVYGVIALAATALVALVGAAALNIRHVGQSGPGAQITLLETYDVIGALRYDPPLKLDAIAPRDPALARELRGDGVLYYSPERNDTLETSQPLQDALGDADPKLIAAQWRDLVLHHTWLYLKVRLEVFRWMFATPDLKVCLPVEAGVDGPPSILQDLGIAKRWDNRDEALFDYGNDFVGTPMLSHVMAALLAVGELVILLWRRRADDIAIAGLLAAALVFTLTFFVISIACDYRYLYFLDVAAMTATLYLALDVPPLAQWAWPRRIHQ